VVVVAGGFLAVAALLVVAPDLLPVSQAFLVDLLADLSGVVGLAGLALVAIAIALVQALWSSTTPASPPPLPRDVSAAEDRSVAVVGRSFDDDLAAAGRIGGRTTEAEAVVREDLRRLATDVYQQVHRCDWETAARAVAEGRWTDDRAAAAFVGGPDAPDVPLSVWFRDVLSDEGAFRRQGTRAIRAISALHEDGADPPSAARTDQRDGGPHLETGTSVPTEVSDP
jgi:hypothetical protein